jgi:hypothetical protein
MAIFKSKLSGIHWSGSARWRKYPPLRGRFAFSLAKKAMAEEI